MMMHHNKLLKALGHVFQRIVIVTAPRNLLQRISRILILKIHIAWKPRSGIGIGLLKATSACPSRLGDTCLDVLMPASTANRVIGNNLTSAKKTSHLLK